MQSHESLPPLIVILGPTAVGKTELSIQLAERINGEIISADSRLFYRGMDIGTAKPSKTERNRVRHHLIDIADPDEIWSLGRFKCVAIDIINNIHERNEIPLLVGGTGQYIRAITEGWVIPKLKADMNLRETLMRWADQIGVQGLHARLQVLDPQAAVKIEPNNIRRTIRALEVIFRTGKQFSEMSEREPVPYNVIQVGLTRPREELYQRIDERVDAMFQSGFVEEVRSLVGQGYSLNLPSMSAIGYAQIASYIEGKITLEEAVMLIKRMTRQFVRKQANWFRKDDPNISWFEIAPGIIEEIGIYIHNRI
jgi:tRNA dimethylallyltransferase